MEFEYARLCQKMSEADEQCTFDPLLVLHGYEGTKRHKDLERRVAKCFGGELHKSVGHPSLHLVPAMSCKSLPLGTPRVKQIMFR